MTDEQISDLAQYDMLDFFLYWLSINADSVIMESTPHKITELMATQTDRWKCSVRD